MAEQPERGLWSVHRYVLFIINNNVRSLSMELIDKIEISYAALEAETCLRSFLTDSVVESIHSLVPRSLPIIFKELLKTKPVLELLLFLTSLTLLLFLLLLPPL